MVNKDFEELIHSLKPSSSMRMKYDTGGDAGLHSRGNVLLGAGRFMTSLKPRWIDMLTMNVFF